MTKKKKIIIVSAIICFTILMGVLFGVYIVNKSKEEKDYSKTSQTEVEKNKTIETLTEVEQEIAGIDKNNSENIKNNEISEKNYSELYKEYLKLPEEEKKKNEAIPRKEDVPFEKLEEIKEDLDKDKKTDENIIPEKFNLADVIDIKVENQGGLRFMLGFCFYKST